MGKLAFANHARAQVGQQVVHVLVLAYRQYLGIVDVLVDSPQFPLEDLTAPLDVGPPGLPAEPMPDALPGAGRLDVTPIGIQPVQAGPALHLGGHNLHRVAVLKRRVQRYQPSVDLGADATVPKLGVNLVGEINGGRARGKLYDVSLWGVDKNLIVEQVLFD